MQELKDRLIESFLDSGLFKNGGVDTTHFKTGQQVSASSIPTFVACVCVYVCMCVYVCVCGCVCPALTLIVCPRLF